MIAGGESWREAFGWRRNLAGLFHRPPGHFPFVDGVRALAVLWVMAFHAVLFLAPHQGADTWSSLVAGPGGYLALQGELGVDAFFVISGFLIAHMLMGEVARTGRLAIGRFYWRRIGRLVPAHLVALGLCALLFPKNIETAWTNVIYLNNFVPFEHAFMGWGWSLAIEEQFYVLFPGLLLALYALRWGRLTGLLVLFFASLVLRWVTITTHGLPAGAFPFPPPWLNFQVIDPYFSWHWQALYTAPWCRAGALLAGVIAAYIIHHTPWRAYVDTRGTASATALFVFGGLCIAGVMSVARIMPPGIAGGPFTLPVAATGWYLASFTHVFATGVACLLLACFAARGPGRWLAIGLGWRGWYPIAQLSYAAYLLDPLATGALYALTAARHGVAPGSASLYYVGSFILTFGAAMGLYLTVERPMMTLRGPARLAEAMPSNGVSQLVNAAVDSEKGLRHG